MDAERHDHDGHLAINAQRETWSWNNLVENPAVSRTCRSEVSVLVFTHRVVLGEGIVASVGKGSNVC